MLKVKTRIDYVIVRSLRRTVLPGASRGESNPVLGVRLGSGDFMTFDRFYVSRFK